MVKYYKPEDVAINTGTDTYVNADWIGREVVAFGENGVSYPGRKGIDWTWDIITGELTLTGSLFLGASYHLEFALITDATQDFTDVIDPGTDITQYFHILKYAINNWSSDTGGDVTFVNRRCRAEFGGGAPVLFNGERSSGIVYLPLPELSIDEGIPVAVYLSESVVISGKVKQYRKGLFNERLWL